MIVVYLAIVFVAGWLASWKLAEQIARKAFRHPGIVAKALGTITYERLLNLRDQVAVEVEKRRAPL